MTCPMSMTLVMSNNEDSKHLGVCVLPAILDITTLTLLRLEHYGSNLSFDSSLGKDSCVPSLESSEIVPSHLGKASKQYDNIMPVDVV